MEGDLKAVGQRINFTVEEFTRGPMVEVMMENISKIKSMDSEFTSGQMVRNMRDIGNKENNTVKESSLIHKENQE